MAYTAGMDEETLELLRRQHPGWRLLAAQNGPLLAAFLHRVFVAANERTLCEAALTARLDDYLYRLRARLGEEAMPRTAQQYLNDWAADERGWLRKYYRTDSDEPHYDLTPATEKGLQWLASLQGRHFVGAESRLLAVFELLGQISEGAETDPAVRIAELERRKRAIEDEIAAVRAGHLQPMDDTRVRERFLLMAETARGLLADFRQVEQNFRDLDRQVREKVARWEGGKGEMLAEVLGERDAIADSDQGRSFHAFWDFLMSPARQEQLSTLLERVLALPAVAGLGADPRLRRVHYDWLDAGEQALRTVARLSAQLRRYLDDQAWLENRRIMQLLHDVEQHALALRETIDAAPGMAIDDTAPDINLPLERPLYRPPFRARIDSATPETGAVDLDAAVLFEQFYVDRAALRARLRRALQTRDQISLARLLEETPIERGLAELVTWLALAADDPDAHINDAREVLLDWHDEAGVKRQAHVPEVLFTRGRHAPG